MRVIELEVADISDLIRLHANLKQDKYGLIYFEDERNRKILGFYYSSFIKNIDAVFIYHSTNTKPPRVISYAPFFNGREVIEKGPIDSTSFINIPIAYIEDTPHEVVDPAKIKMRWRIVKVTDILSLVVLACMSYYNNVVMPYIWYDEMRKVYVLVIHSSNDEVSAVYFTLNDRYKSPYISLDIKRLDIQFSESVSDVSRSYVLVVKAKSLPYFDISKK